MQNVLIVWFYDQKVCLDEILVNGVTANMKGIQRKKKYFLKI